MGYCAWCKKWGRTPVVKLTEPRHILISDGVEIIQAVGVVPVAAGKTICERHHTISTEEASRRWKRDRG